NLGGSLAPPHTNVAPPLPKSLHEVMDSAGRLLYQAIAHFLNVDQSARRKCRAGEASRALVGLVPS
ncbi:hypothetical protein A2U01_0075007, partial [Trifolium medium]|nr:hypothetical protein [Trifolium medium]